MLVILPLIALTFLILLFSQSQNCWRKAVLDAGLVMGFLITLFSEVLSLFHGLGKVGLAVAWLGVIFVCVYWHFKSRYTQKTPARGFVDKRLLKIPAAFIVLSGIVFFVAGVGVVAITAPPNNWDSMTYHMNRVVHWMQNHSVKHYPTYYLPQLFHPPWSSFAILHLQILSGSDRFANLVQWFSMIGSIIAVSLIAKQLDAKPSGQLFAALFCATIPMGILQGSSTQNDFVVTFWLVCFAFYALLIIQLGINLPRLLAVSTSLGLATLTKTTAYFYGFPFAIWLLVWAVCKYRSKTWKILVTAGLIILALNLNHYLRNIELFGSILGAPASYQKEYKIEILSLPTFTSNLLRNLSLHLDIVRNLGLQPLIKPITGIADKLIRILHTGLGVSVNDPRTTWPPNSFAVAGLSFDENTCGNPLHFLLILVAIGLFFWHKSFIKQRIILGYLAALLSGFFILCLLLKWQPYHSRHHLFLFVSFSAFVAVIFSKTLNKKALFALALTLLVFSSPWVFYNKSRPILARSNIFNTPRLEQYFVTRPWVKTSYIEAVHFVQNQSCYNIGFSLEELSFTSTTVPWEYPFWAIARENKPTQTKFEHIKLQNSSAILLKKYPHTQFQPCAIIAFEPANTPLQQRQTFVSKNVTFTRQWSLPPLTVYLK